MSEFERVESVVRIVVGRPVSYLAFAIMIASRWLYYGACRMGKRVVSSTSTKGQTCPQMRK